MDFNKFQTEFFSQLKSKNKKCLETIETNKTLIKENLGENANLQVIKNFVAEINNVIVENDNLINIIIDGNKNITPFVNKFDLIKKVLNHPHFNRVLEVFNNSDVLIRACKEGNRSAANWLITMNISPYTQDEDGMSALMYAAQHHFTFVIKPYLYDSLCLNLEDKNGENVLFHSIRNPKFLMDDLITNNQYQYDLILNSDININQTNHQGESVLTYCIKNNIIEPICKFLLHNTNIDVNIADNEGKTPAMYLTEKGLYLELLKLHAKHCDYDYIDMNGQSALSILLEKMYNYNKETDQVQYMDYARVMSTFVNYQCDFNYSVDNDENTAFMVFLIVNDMATAKFCAKYLKKLDLSVKNKYGENATSLCYKLGHYKLIPLLKDNPTFNYGYRDPINHNNLLMISIVNNYLGIKELLENDPSIINEVNNKNENGLIIASKINQVKAVEILLERGIYIDHQDNLGNTALHYAVDIQEPYLISKLMSKEPNIHLKNNEGKSALDLAQEIEGETKNEIICLLTNPNYKLKKIKFNSQSTNKYTEEIQKYIIPYANNYFPDFKSTNKMENAKNIIYQRNEMTNTLDKKTLCFDFGICVLRISLFLIVIFIFRYFH
ncbi:ankyrin [Neocallimastix californiae]|jgi:ankyrin repeat protein|uniref:Ankyrin n=1 Tax=Neocallimastix californiae TaxID=1754190 RepID=A0A1Y2D6L8_9FUNG|nr:ankyrin [Neocallimastix californiae]|eukprot:ORY54920.1 ankyrin [Neocallimastix californiae]